MGDGGIPRATDRAAHAHGSARIRSFYSAVTGAAGMRRARRRQSSSLPVHATIPPVFDSIVAPVAQSSSDFSPPLAHFMHEALDNQPLLDGNGLPVERRLEVLMETLTALLGRPIVHVLRNADPVIRALLANELK